tara:strand:+ start:7634 stop:8074 length:441 start_codon:yes stop_codon:yes gene_type:complete
MELVRQKQRQPGVSTVVPNETYAMIADVLAGKIMTELAAGRGNAAAETATELNALLNQGVGTGSINANYIIMQVMDIYESGNLEMAQQAEGYLETLINYGLGLDSLNTTALSNSLNRVSENSECPKCIDDAEALAGRLLDKAGKTF